MSPRTAVAALMLSALAALPAHAVVKYTFSGFNSEGQDPGVYTNPISFTLTVPDFITADTFFPSASLDACSNAASTCVGVTFNMDGTEYGGPGLQVVEFGGVTQTSFHYYAPAPGLPFSTPGTYGTEFSFNPATLTVSVVPEPATTALMLAGLALVGTAARRRSAG